MLLTLFDIVDRFGDYSYGFMLYLLIFSKLSLFSLELFFASIFLFDLVFLGFVCFLISYFIEYLE